MKQINDKDFEEVVLKNGKVVLLDAYATWCGPCKMLAPVLEQLESTTSDWLEIVKVNVDEADEIAASLQVTGIPALFIFRNGELVDKTMGYQSLEELNEFVGKYR